MLLKTTPKFKQKDLSIEKLCPKGVDGMASSVDPNQTAPLSDLGLHCFLKRVCP